jgi:radical SAM superfamily enzyme YgiQ (UPF0313 family)
MNQRTERMPIDVALVQINNSFSGQNYFPYSVGLLQAYVQKQAKTPDAYRFRLPVYKRIAVDEAVQEVLGADIIGFSTYVWNINISLEIAKKVKNLKPETLIIFGGPQVPDQVDAFMKKNAFIDLCCHGEGERIFLDVLEHYGPQDWENVPGISFRNSEGQCVTNPKGTRLKDLAEIPSPFLDGVFDELIEKKPDEQWLALWETNRGCPFSCTFCDWGSATASKVYRFDMDRLLKEIEWFAQQKIEFIFCCDANFGILPRDIEIAQYAAKIKQQFGYPQALSVQNTKNAQERAYTVQKILSDAGLNKGVTIALQSVDENTLKSIKRDNISSGAYQELQRRFAQAGVETYTDMILGLPGETYDSFADGVDHIIANGQHNRIQFNNLSILPNAEMGDPIYQATHGMKTVEIDIINIHGQLNDTENEVKEIQDLVIATNTMPKDDWAKTRSFSWMTALLHFDKIMQIPFVLLHEVCSVSYRDLIEAFSNDNVTEFPVLSELQSLFMNKALDIQNGGPEYIPSSEWLDIWWPADEYGLIKLVTEEKLEMFYQEAEMVLTKFLQKRFISIPQPLAEAIQFNKNLVKLPFQTENLEMRFSYNLWEFYRSVLLGNTMPLEEKEMVYTIDRKSETWNSWADWYQKVIWYGNKKGAYLYGNVAVGTQIAGHF